MIGMYERNRLGPGEMWSRRRIIRMKRIQHKTNDVVASKINERRIDD